MLLLVYKQEGTSTCFYTHVHTHIYPYIYAAVFSSEAESNKSFSTQEYISIDVKPCFERVVAQNANLRIWGIEGAKTPDSGFTFGEDFLPQCFVALVFGQSSALTCVAPLGSVPRLHKG